MSRYFQGLEVGCCHPHSWLWAFEIFVPLIPKWALGLLLGSEGGGLRAVFQSFADHSFISYSLSTHYWQVPTLTLNFHPPPRAKDHIKVLVPFCLRELCDEPRKQQLWGSEREGDFSGC